MFAHRDTSKTMIAVMVAIAVLAVAIPTCQMVGCNMTMCGGMMRISTLPGPSAGAPCGGIWVSGANQLGTLPNSFFSALIALIAALGMAVLTWVPTRTARLLFVAEANAPPPPLDPRGERFRL